MSTIRKIGTIKKEIVELLDLDIKQDTPILIGDSNEEHIKNRHPVEYDKYFNQIDEIIDRPDYVGYSKRNASITYIKEFYISSEYIKVAVKVAKSGNAYAKTLFLMNTYKVESYLEKGTLIKVEKP